MRKLFIAIIIFCIFLSGVARAAVLQMKLLKAGPKSAVVEYRGQEITVRKYYSTSSKPLGPFLTSMSYLSPCIGNFVVAIVDDTNGEILSLGCNGKQVLVVPDEFIK